MAENQKKITICAECTHYIPPKKHGGGWISGFDVCGASEIQDLVTGAIYNLQCEDINDGHCEQFEVNPTNRNVWVEKWYDARE